MLIGYLNAIIKVLKEHDLTNSKLFEIKNIEPWNEGITTLIKSGIELERKNNKN